jgi:hypothetical protein
MFVEIPEYSTSYHKCHLLLGYDTASYPRRMESSNVGWFQQQLYLQLNITSLNSGLLIPKATSEHISSTLVPLQSDNILDMDSLFCSIKANGSQI